MSAIAALVFLAGACNQTSGTTVGSVTEVEGSLTDVVSFTILAAGTEIEFLPIPGQVYDFALPHLREHLRTGELVVVEWELRDGLRYALSLEDG